MKNLTNLKCRNCNKTTCSHGLDYVIIIVHFEGSKKCNITYKLYSKCAYNKCYMHIFYF